MVRNSMLLAAAVLAGAAVPAHAGVAAASAPIALTSTLQIDRLVEQDGVKRHVLVSAAKVLPGDHLVFTTSYANNSAKPFDNFVVTNPLPKEVTLSDDGAFVVSVDGGAHWGKLATLTVADGKGGQRAAQAGDVTHLRWTVPTIAPGAAGKLEYRAVVR